MKNFHRQIIAISVFAASLLFITFLSPGCDDSGVITKTTVANPDVKVFDSLWVEEFMDSTSSCGLNLFDGTTVTRDSLSKDCQLIDTNGTGTGFYLRSGDLSDLNVPIGYKTRFNRIYASISKARFDTITVLPVNRDTILPALDFTADGTNDFSYFEPNLSGDQPVFSFYLQGKSLNVQGRNIYGIIQPIESTDNNPGIGGYKMSFRVRINFTGKNDFRKTIEQ